MKNMTNAKSRRLGKKELRQVFKALRLKDGLTETAEDGEFTYWYNKARDGRTGNYIIYEVVDSDPAYRADDVVIARDFFCQIDIFSIRSFETKPLADLIDRLETKLCEQRFEVNMEDERYEPDTKLYHLILFVSKLYF